MPYALVLTGGSNVTIPSKAFGQDFDFWIDFEIDTYTSQTFLGRGTGSNTNQVYPIDSTTIGWRQSATSSITLSEPIPLNTRHYLRFSRNNDSTVTVRNLAGDIIGTLNTTVSLTDMTRIGLSLGRQFSGKIYAMGITIDGGVEQLYLNESDPSATTFGDGTVNGEYSWVEYTNTPATPPQGVTTIGSITPAETTASVPYSYNLSDQTGFQYRIDGGTALTASASPILLTGLTASTTYTIEVRATNTAGVGAWSAVAQFTTTEAAGLPPQGITTVGSITTGETTASIPFSYDDADQSGFDYRLDGGTPLEVVSNPILLTGLTDTTTYDIEVRAVNGTGVGAWSAVAQFTTDTPATINPIIIFGADKVLEFNTGGIRANLTGLSVDIYDVTTRELVLSVTGHTTGADAVPDDIQNAALAASTQYRVVILAPDGSEAVFRESTQ